MKIRIAVLACLAALALAGCIGHTHSLIQGESDREITVGTFRHDGPEGSMMVLEFRGKRFEARGFAIERNQNLAELKRHYGIDRKHWDRISSGMDTDHYVYSAEPVLHAENGATLRCPTVWRANGAPAGHCVTAEGTHINFQFE
jgi:hypothetical protein